MIFQELRKRQGFFTKLVAIIEWVYQTGLKNTAQVNSGADPQHVNWHIFYRGSGAVLIYNCSGSGYCVLQHIHL